MFSADNKNPDLIFDPTFTYITASSRQSLISDIREWLIKNFLMVNDTKTGALVVSFMDYGPIYFPPVTVESDLILPSDTMCNPRVVFDSNMCIDN